MSENVDRDSVASHCSTRHLDDVEKVDSMWLATFCEKLTAWQYRVGHIQFDCDAGQWIAYTYGYGRCEQVWHKLVEVNTRGEVRQLLTALKLDA